NGNPQNGCLLKGTKISTPAGDRLVQDLQIGDEVQTLAGRKTIKWIGYNKFTKEEGRAWQHSVMPIRVARFAIDDHTPHRDLYLSPLHCIFFNESLIPVMYLVNEASIAQGMPSDMSAIELRRERPAVLGKQASFSITPSLILDNTESKRLEFEPCPKNLRGSRR